MALSPSLFSWPLALPVAFRRRAIVLAQLLPVARMLRAPLLRGIPAPLPIHRIGGDLPPMVIVAASPLAAWIAASSLSRLKLGWQKCFLAIAAGPFSHEPVLACHGAPLSSGSSLHARQFRNSCRVRTAPPPLGRFF